MCCSVLYVDICVCSVSCASHMLHCTRCTEHLPQSSVEQALTSGLSCRCQRLGLVSLAYLWRRDQGELLREMTSHLSAIIIKVAAIGERKRSQSSTL